MENANIEKVKCDIFGDFQTLCSCLFGFQKEKQVISTVKKVLNYILWSSIFWGENTRPRKDYLWLVECIEDLYLKFHPKLCCWLTFRCPGTVVVVEWVNAVLKGEKCITAAAKNSQLSHFSSLLFSFSQHFERSFLRKLESIHPYINMLFCKELQHKEIIGVPIHFQSYRQHGVWKSQKSLI